MLALSPPLHFSTFGWSLEEEKPISHEQQQQQQQHNYFYRETQTSESILHDFPSPLSQILLNQDHSTPSPTIINGDHDDPTMNKKLNHNASERERRTNINRLYSSLRSLLPDASDRTKKLSIPVIVSRALKYIPELQEEVEQLTQKKKKLSSRFTRESENRVRRSSSSVSISKINDREVGVQISTIFDNVHKIALSEVLLNLQEYGLHLLNGASFESFGGRVFYNLHLQVEGARRIESEVLTEKLLSLFS